MSRMFKNDRAQLPLSQSTESTKVSVWMLSECILYYTYFKNFTPQVYCIFCKASACFTVMQASVLFFKLWISIVFLNCIRLWLDIEMLCLKGDANFSSIFFDVKTFYLNDNISSCVPVSGDFEKCLLSLFL